MHEENAVLKGTVARIRYESIDNNYQIVIIRDKNGTNKTAVIRNAAVRHGENITLTGSWQNYKSGELQFVAKNIERKLPSTKEGLIAYLSSNRMKGIGPATAKKIVEHFGEETLIVLNEKPERLLEISRIGKKKVRLIRETWNQDTAERNVIIFLQSHGISITFANKIYRKYGPKAAVIIQENPYRLARDIRGIGFRMADAIARKAGIGLNDPRRIAAGIFFLLYTASLEGHCFLPKEKIYERGEELLSIKNTLITNRLGELIAHKMLVYELDHEKNSAIYLKEIFQLENIVAKQIETIATNKKNIQKMDALTLASIENRYDLTLHSSQREALLTIMNSSFSVLTGGPGTGKTTIIRLIVEFAEQFSYSVELAAPTGRAAKRLAQATNSEAKTIHRMLSYTGIFQKNQKNPLRADLIIIDEASMLDLNLAYHLFDAVDEGCSVILVGDADQLPSVGAGDVLADIINSKHITVAKLTHIFRQAEDSEIILCAHDIKNGILPVPSSSNKGGYFFIKAKEPQKASDITVHLVTKRIPKAFGFSIHEIQVLVPTHNGILGTVALNKNIAKALDLQGVSVNSGEYSFKCGDKVMQIKNNYTLNVFNGDIGIVNSIANKIMKVYFDDRLVEYGNSDIKQLQLAYAISVHKSQGSEFKAVVLVLAMQHYIMLQRNLLYTAVTRAKERLIIVGVPRALQRAINNISAVKRHTRLDTRLQKRMSSQPNSTI